KFIISNGGKAVVTAAEVGGNDKVNKITESIINNPLIDDNINIMDAKNILISIAGGLNMTLFEVDKIINGLRSKASKSTYVNFGEKFYETMEEKIKCSVIATSIYDNQDSNLNNSNHVVSKNVANHDIREESVKKKSTFNEPNFNKVEENYNNDNDIKDT